MEPYYELKDHAAHRVMPDGVRTQLQPGIEQWRGDDMAWGYAGSAPNTAASAMLADVGATSAEVDHSRLCIGFVSDVLGLVELDEPFAMAVREVRAWVEERANELLSEKLPGPDDPLESHEVFVESAIRNVEGGPRSTWLESFRSVHGQPDIPS